jgi:hypothetical protein
VGTSLMKHCGRRWGKKNGSEEKKGEVMFVYQE